MTALDKAKNIATSTASNVASGAAAPYQGDTSVVIGSVTGATLVTIVAHASDSEGIMKPIIGGFILGTLLLLVSIWSADVANAFAVIVLITSLLVNGEQLFANIANASK